MNIDSGMFPDVADALGIDSPAIVEKDVYAVQLLSLLSTLRSEAFELVFAGGTSLAKAHQNLFRMSEDIDIKLIARDGVATSMSSSLSDLRLMDELRRGFFTPPCVGVGVGAVVWLLTCPSASARRF